MEITEPMALLRGVSCGSTQMGTAGRHAPRDLSDFYQVVCLLGRREYREAHRSCGDQKRIVLYRAG